MKPSCPGDRNLSPPVLSLSRIVRKDISRPRMS
jgi:hypothetical protein